MRRLKITDKDIEKALDRIPPFPGVVARALKFLRDPASLASKVAEEVAKDPVLSFEILRISNSPLYGFSRRISSLEHAIALLGIKTTESVIMAAYAKTVYDKELKFFKLKRGEISIQSFVGGYVAKEVAHDYFPDVEGVAFTSAILRNIGKLAMEYFLEKYYDEVQAELSKGKSFDKIEKELFGFSSAEISSMVIKNWQIPEEIAEVVKVYNEPSVLEDKASPIYKAAVAVHIGDRIAMMTGLGASIDSLNYSIDETIFNNTRISKSDFERYLEKTIQAYPSFIEDIKDVIGV